MKTDSNVLNLGKSIPGTILRLSWPAILEQLLISMATLADTAMVGSIGAAATASVAVNISTVWLINGFITALSVGFSYLVSHAIGAGDQKKTESAVRQSISASLLLGLILTVVLLAIHRPLPRWLGAAADVIPNAQIYMGIISLSLIPQTLSVVLAAVLRSAGNTRIPLYTNLGANLFNIVGNFFLIYPSRQVTLPSFGGNTSSLSLSVWGADLGIGGAALATTLSRYLMALLLLYHIYRTPTAARISLKGKYRLKKQTMRQMLRISIPVMLERNTLCFGQIALTAMISGLGTAPLAAHYLTNETESILYLPAYGFSYTATTLVGQSLGAGRPDLAKSFTKWICMIGAAVIVGACIPVYLFSGNIIWLFTNDAQVAVLGCQTLKIAAATEIFFSFFVIASGVFRGAGDVNFPLAVSLIGMWGLRIGLVYLATHIFSFGVSGVWIAIAIDCFLRSCLCLWRLCSGKWIHAEKKD